MYYYNTALSWKLSLTHSRGILMEFLQMIIMQVSLFIHEDVLLLWYVCMSVDACIANNSADCIMDKVRWLSISYMLFNLLFINSLKMSVKYSSLLMKLPRLKRRSIPQAQNKNCIDLTTINICGAQWFGYSTFTFDGSNETETLNPQVWCDAWHHNLLHSN